MMRMKSTMIDTAPSLIKNYKSRMPSHREMGIVSGKVKAVIMDRTLKGESSEGVPFSPYRTKPYYAPIENRPPGYPTPSGGKPSRTGKTMRFESFTQYKQKMGFGNRPTLSISNQMLSDIIWIVRSKTKALLFFASRLSAAKAHRHHTGFYPFFGISPSDLGDINRVLRERLRAIRQEARAHLQRQIRRAA